MKKPLNYSITWVENGEEKETIKVSHQGMLETYLEMLSSKKNLSSLKVWKIYKRAEKEEYTVTLNKFITCGK